MKLLSIAAGLMLALPALAAGTDHCSLNLAKRFANGVIAVDMKETREQGRLVWERRNSHEYTMEWLDDQLRMGGDPRGEYAKIKQEITANPDLHVYYLQYGVKRQDGNNVAYYWQVRLENYHRGCSLKSIAVD